MATRRPLWLGLGAALLLALGMGVGWRLGADRAAAAEPEVGVPSGRPGDEDLAGLLREISAEVRALREQSVLDRPQAGARQPVLPSPDRLEELVEKLRRVVDRLESTPLAGQPPQPIPQSALDQIQADGFRSLDEIGALYRSPLEGQLYLDRVNRVRRAHLFWRVDQVLARYGPPTEIDAESPTIRVRYAIGATADEPRSLMFMVSPDGVVTNSYVD